MFSIVHLSFRFRKISTAFLLSKHINYSLVALLTNTIFLSAEMQSSPREKSLEHQVEQLKLELQAERNKTKVFA
jgi:hypothetical protein